MNCYFQQGKEKDKRHLVNITKNLALFVDSTDLQLCIIGFQLYKSVLLCSTFQRTWYISKEFYLNVTLKAWCARDHSKCQNSLTRPMTEFRISLHHIFLKWISKIKLCIWNLDLVLCCYPASLPSKLRCFTAYLFSGSVHLERAMSNATMKHISCISNEIINLNLDCILQFYLCTGTDSFT